MSVCGRCVGTSNNQSVRARARWLCHQQGWMLAPGRWGAGRAGAGWSKSVESWLDPLCGWAWRRSRQPHQAGSPGSTPPPPPPAPPDSGCHSRCPPPPRHCTLPALRPLCCPHYSETLHLHRLVSFQVFVSVHWDVKKDQPILFAIFVFSSFLPMTLHTTVFFVSLVM